MKSLPILTPELTPIERETPQKRNEGCKQCSLHTHCSTGVNKSVCVAPTKHEGANPEAGTILVLMDSISEYDDAEGQVGHSRLATLIRNTIARVWRGNIVFDSAIKCRVPPPSGDKKLAKNNVESWVRACRGYLAHTINRIQKLTKIICLGQGAYYATLGRSISPLSMRRGWGWLTQRSIPVYGLMHPAQAFDNTFYRQWLLEDLIWASSQDKPPLDKPDGVAYLVNNAEDAQVAYSALASCDGLSVDCEWFGAPYDADFRLMTVALVGRGQKDSYVWTRSALREGQKATPGLLLAKLLTDPNKKIYGQYIKADAHGLYCGLGIKWFPGFTGDTQVWMRLLETESRADLEAAAERVGWGGHKSAMQLALVGARARVASAAQVELQTRLTAQQQEQDRLRKRKRGVSTKDQTMRMVLDEEDTFMSYVHTDRLKAIVDKKAKTQDAYAYGYVPKHIRDPYCAADTAATMRLAELLEGRVANDPQITRVWDKLMRKGVEAIWRIENAGFPIDRERIHSNIDYFRTELDGVLPKIAALGIADPSKNNAVIDFLYNELDLPIPKFTKHGVPAVDEEALDSLRIEKPGAPKHEWEFMHPIVPLLLDQRRFSKYLGTYSEGLLTHVRSDGRVHCNIRPDVARSGRLSAGDPNLQNVPAAEDDPLSVLIRDAFMSRPGWVFIKSDFDQLEYKMTAVVSGDPVMIDIFKRGDDIHTGTTKEIVGPVMFGIKAEDWDKQDKEVKKSQRKIGKTMNFAALYGMGIKSLSKRLGVTEEVAKQILDGMLSKFKKYAQFKEREVAHSRKYGFSRTFWFGANPGEFEPFRKRMNQGITSKDNGVKAKAERIATNSCIQGFASDLCIFAMIRLVQWIDENFIPAELVMTIHDALIIHCHKDYVEEVAYFMKVIMEDYSCGDVPITVSTDVGETWGLMIPYDEEVGRLIRMYGYSAALEFYRAEQAKKNKKA